MISCKAMLLKLELVIWYFERRNYVLFWWYSTLGVVMYMYIYTYIYLFIYILWYILSINRCSRKRLKRTIRERFNLKNFYIRIEEPTSPRPFACWDWGFQISPGHGCLSYVNIVCCEGRGLCDRRADPSSRGVLSSMSLSVIRCNINPLHLPCVHRRDQNKKERKIEQQLSRSGKQTYYESLRVPRLFDKFRGFIKFNFFLLSHIPLAISILRQMSSVPDFPFYSIRLSMSTENTYTQFFPKHSPFFRFSRLNLLWISLFTVVAAYLAHRILLRLVAVVSHMLFLRYTKQYFFTCFPVDWRELNHIAAFVSGNLESFDVHAIPKFIKM
jgi:hypothetical protein